MAHTDVPEILNAIKDATFPAGKDELLRTAQHSGASDSVIAALQGIPPEEYENKDDVAHSVRTAPDSDLPHSAAQHAEQARHGGKHGLAQQLRDVPKPPVQEELEKDRRPEPGR